MADKQSSQGQTLQRAQEQGRDPSSSTVWGQPGFQPPREAQSFTWEGDIASAPDWVDRGWAGYDAGPALHVPKGDPNQAPYTTQVVRVGDTVTYTPGPGGTFGGFAVATAQDSGRQPGPQVDQLNAETGTPTFRPAAQTEADLAGLVKTGLVSPEDMDPDARTQLAMRQNQGKALTAEQAGHIPSEEGPMTPGGSGGRPTPGQRDPNVGAPPRGDLPPPSYAQEGGEQEEERERRERHERERRQEQNREQEKKEQDEKEMREENERKERERREQPQRNPQPTQQPAPPRPPGRTR